MSKKLYKQQKKDRKARVAAGHKNDMPKAKKVKVAKTAMPKVKPVTQTPEEKLTYWKKRAQEKLKSAWGECQNGFGEAMGMIKHADGDLATVRSAVDGVGSAMTKLVEELEKVKLVNHIIELPKKDEKDA